MGKAHKKGKQSAEQKRDAFWNAIRQQKLKDVRGGLSATGIEAHTRNDQGLTSIMLAASIGKDRALDTLLDWYERRRELRSKGWLNIRDDNGRTALMLAAMAGHALCVESLLNKGAHPTLKDDNGKTARDMAAKKKNPEVLEMIDDFLRESDDEEVGEDAGIDEDGLTSTQRNRLRKREMQKLERRGHEEEETELAKEVVKEKGPSPLWPEVAAVVESVDMLRPLQQIAVQRADGTASTDAEKENGGTDPALWYLYSVTRMEVRLPKGVLTRVPGTGLQRMSQLVYLLLNENSLNELPSEIGDCTNLRVLEVANNELTALPSSLNKLENLETLNVANNSLTTLENLNGCTNLATLNVSYNQLDEFDCDFDQLARIHDLILSGNQATELPAEIGSIPMLENLSAEHNKITFVPSEFSQLKKLKTFKLVDGNPIKDQKVVKMLKREGKGLKELWKYLQKNAGKGGKGKGKKKKKQQVQESESEDEVEQVTEKVADVSVQEDDDADSDDSFDIDMDDL